MAKDAPPPSSIEASQRMRATGQRDTVPEVALRKELHRRGLRFRLHRSMRELSRSKPDVTFVSAKLAVYVDGCFWHSCPIHASQPRANSAWWLAKLAANVTRDRRIDEELRAGGWRVVRVWEHEDPIEAADRIESLIRSSR